jgi:hypothetical protein
MLQKMQMPTRGKIRTKHKRLLIFGCWYIKTISRSAKGLQTENIITYYIQNMTPEEMEIYAHDGENPTGKAENKQMSKNKNGSVCT